MAHLYPGEFFGEVTLIEMHNRSATVVAEGATMLYELTAQILYSYKADIRAYVMAMQNINRELCRRLSRADHRIAEPMLRAINNARHDRQKASLRLRSGSPTKAAIEFGGCRRRGRSKPSQTYGRLSRHDSGDALPGKGRHHPDHLAGPKQAITRHRNRRDAVAKTGRAKRETD